MGPHRRSKDESGGGAALRMRGAPCRTTVVEDVRTCEPRGKNKKKQQHYQLIIFPLPAFKHQREQVRNLLIFFESSRCLQTPSQCPSWFSPPSTILSFSFVRRKDCWKSSVTQRWSPMFKPWRQDGENGLGAQLWITKTYKHGTNFMGISWALFIGGLALGGVPKLIQLVDHPLGIGLWDLETCFF